MSALALSTPHGTLGTLGSQVIRRKNKSCRAFNSTRYIRNPCSEVGGAGTTKLSTPHGTLGTGVNALPFFKQIRLSTPHGTLGTTRRSWRENASSSFLLSTPHGTLGTRPSPSEKGGWELLSTPHGTLGTLSLLLLIGVAFSFQLHTVH